MMRRLLFLLCLLAGLVPLVRAAAPVTATPLQVTTSWLGNTLNPGEKFWRTAERRYTLSYFGDLDVTPDGMVFCSSTWEEGGNRAAVYKDGDYLIDSPIPGAINAVDVTDHFIYYGEGNRIVIIPRTPGQATNGRRNAEGLASRTIPVVTATPNPLQLGLAADEAHDRLFVSQTTQGNDSSIRVYRLSDGTPLARKDGAFPSTRPGRLELDARGNLWVLERAQESAPTLLTATPFGSRSEPGSGPEMLNRDEQHQFATADGGGYVGLDFGQRQRLAVVRVAVTGGSLLGAFIQAANDLNGPWTDLHLFAQEPGGWPEKYLTVSDPTPYRYLRLQAPVHKKFAVRALEAYTLSTPAPARIVSFTPDGLPLPMQITAIPQASAIFYDAPRDRLLVADNGPNQQIAAFTQLTTTPTLDQTFGKNGWFGTKGGLFNGPPSTYGTYGPLRFDNMRDIGADATGNIYVGQVGAMGISQTRIESYTPAGALRWSLQGTANLDSAQADPRDETAVYNAANRYTMDYTRPAGNEWTMSASSLNPWSYPQDPRMSGNGQLIYGVRVIQGHFFLITSDQGQGVYSIFRFNPQTDGNTAIPCGMIRAMNLGMQPPYQAPTSGHWIWRDRNGNGQFDADEYDVEPRIWLFGSNFDDDGNFWYTDEGTQKIYRIAVGARLDKFGAPVWSWSSPDNREWAIPAPFDGDARQYAGGYGSIKRLWYDTATRTLYVLGFNHTFSNTVGHNAPAGRLLVRYRVEEDALVKLDELALPYDADVAGEPHDQPYTLRIAGNFVFVGYELTQSNRVYRKADLRYVGTTMVGPQSVAPIYDGPPELIVSVRKNGEYLLFQPAYTNTATTMLRWLPGTAPAVPLPTDLTATPHPGGLLLQWKGAAAAWKIEGMAHTTAGWGPWQPLGTVKIPTLTQTLLPGKYAYRVRAVTAQGAVSDYSKTCWVTVEK